MTASVAQAATLRRTGSVVATLAASELLGKVATFVTFLVLARVLGVAEFGVLSFGLSLGLLLGVLSSLGLDARVVQLGSAQPDLLDRCYGAIVVIRTVISSAVVVTTSVVLFLTMATPNAVTVTLLVASCLLDTFGDAARAACGALQRQEFAAMMLVVQRFCALLLSAVGLTVTSSAWGAALGYFVATCLGVLGMYVAARRASARVQVHGSRPAARMVLQAAPVMGAEAVVTMGIFRIDAALIGILLGTTAVGVYGAGYRVFETILFISWTLSRAYVPVIASRATDRQHVRIWAQRALVVVCAVYAPYGMVLALRGDDVVGLLFGAAYVHPGLMLALATAPLLFGISHVGASVLLALRPDPVVLVASSIALVVSVGLNLWLLPRWGITAAAVATSVAFLVQAAIVMGALTRITGSIVPVRAMTAIVVATVCAGVVARTTGPLAPALIGSAVTYLVVWAAASRLLDPPSFAEFRSLVRRHPGSATSPGSPDA